MAEEQKDAQKEFKSCCEGMPLADMMKKMMEAKKGGSPFNCAEMMSHMMEAKKSGSTRNCAEMMSQMMQMCCGSREKKEEATQKEKENPIPNP